MLTSILSLLVIGILDYLHITLLSSFPISLSERQPPFRNSTLLDISHYHLLQIDGPFQPSSSFALLLPNLTQLKVKPVWLLRTFVLFHQDLRVPVFFLVSKSPGEYALGERCVKYTRSGVAELDGKTTVCSWAEQVTGKDFRTILHPSGPAATSLPTFQSIKFGVSRRSLVPCTSCMCSCSSVFLSQLIAPSTAARVVARAIVVVTHETDNECGSENDGAEKEEGRIRGAKGIV